MKRSLLILILGLCVQSFAAADFDPAVCTSKLESAGLGPIALEAPMSRELTSGSPMYTPWKVVACGNTTTQEHRFFAPAQVLENCMALAAQDPAWTPEDVYTCVGTGLYDE